MEAKRGGGHLTCTPAAAASSAITIPVLLEQPGLDAAETLAVIAPADVNKRAASR
jgi:hypothetical protein